MKLDTSILIHAIPALILLAIIEAVLIFKEHFNAKTVKEITASIGVGAGYVILSPLTKGINLVFCTFLYEHRVYDLSNNLLLAWLICFIGDDFTYYWSHRLCHEVRYLWASHSVHHSAESLSLPVAFRLSWTTSLTGIFFLWGWMPLLGISPEMVLFVKSINALYGFWLHTEVIKKLPRWIEFIFSTPSHHRVHHGSNVEYLDKNHGGILIIWDRIFGTYQDEIFTPKYGLTKNINSNNPFVITFYEWKNLLNDLKKPGSLKDRLCYIFRAPGWSKDANSKTTREPVKSQLNSMLPSVCNGNCSDCSFKILHQSTS